MSRRIISIFVVLFVLVGIPRLSEADTHATFPPRPNEADTHTTDLADEAWRLQQGGDLVVVTRGSDGSPQFAVVEAVDSRREVVDVVRNVATYSRVEAVTWDAPLVAGEQAAGESAPTDDYTQRTDTAKTLTGVVAAWPKTDGRNVVVGVIDTGVSSHPDLAGRLLPGGAFTGNVYALDSERADGAARPSDDTSSYGHGSHVAGIIAARPHDERGTTGVAPSASILPVRTDFSIVGIANAIVWAVGGQVRARTSDSGSDVDVPVNPNPASILNLSFNDWLNVLPARNLAMRLALEFAAQQKDVVIVAAAGNCGGCQTNHVVTWDEILSDSTTSGYRLSRTTRNADGSCKTFAVIDDNQLTVLSERRVVVSAGTDDTSPIASCYRAARYHRIETSAQAADFTTVNLNGQTANQVSWEPETDTVPGLVEGRNYTPGAKIFRRILSADDDCNDPNKSEQFAYIGTSSTTTYTDRTIATRFSYCYRMSHWLDWTSSEVISAQAALYRDDDSLPVYPAMDPHVLTVGSVSDNVTLSPGSAGGDGAPGDATSSWWTQVGNGATPDTTNAWLDLVAPGEAIYSLNNSGGYRHDSGTSMSSPHVAGVAALLRSRYPQATRSEIEQVLRLSAFDVSRDNSETGWDLYHGYGLVKAGAAVALADERLSYEPQNVPAVRTTTTTTTTTTIVETPDEGDIGDGDTGNAGGNTTPPLVVTVPQHTTPAITTTTVPVFPQSAPLRLMYARISGTDIEIAVSGSGDEYELRRDGFSVKRSARPEFRVPLGATQKGIHNYNVMAWRGASVLSSVTVRLHVVVPQPARISALTVNGKSALLRVVPPGRGWVHILLDGKVVRTVEVSKPTSVRVSKKGRYQVRFFNGKGASAPSPIRIWR